MNHRRIFVICLLSLMALACSTPDPEAALLFGADAGPVIGQDLRVGVGWDALAGAPELPPLRDGETAARCRSDGECEARLGPLPACKLPRCDFATGLCEISSAPDRALCDDGNACTQGDYCLSGICSGVALDCDDANPCTTDTCDPQTGRCVHVDHENPCDDGDPQTRDDRCREGICVGQPVTCDDGNACTIDSLQGDGSCLHDAAQADGLPCDDGDPLTVEDRCQGGRCRGVVVCDDADPCTLDTWDEASGRCIHDPGGADGAPCDDQDPCTVNDRCLAGACVGEASGCPTCTPVFSEAVVRLTELQIRPTASDNALGALGEQLNPLLRAAVEEGRLTVLFELPSLSPPSEGFRLNAYTRVTPVAPDCDPLSELCTFDVLAADLDDDCRAVNHLEGVRRVDDLVVGGESGVLALRVGDGSEADLEIPIERPWVRALMESEDQRLTRLRGVVKGAVRRAALIEIVGALLSRSASAAAALLDGLVSWDVDLDGDGEAESGSVILGFDSAAARLRSPQATLRCGDLLTCLGECEDGQSGCQQGCMNAATPAAVQQFWALIDCIQANCPDGDQGCISTNCAEPHLACVNG